MIIFLENNKKNLNNLYVSKNHSKFLLKYHVIFSTKYRKRLLRGDFDLTLKEIMIKISKEYDFNIDVLETDQDHIHMLINSVPKLSPLTIVRTLKSKSTKEMWNKYPKKMRENYWKERTLWSDGYFVCSCGDASTKTIKKYIESQG